jgi:hypothetical protein
VRRTSVRAWIATGAAVAATAAGAVACAAVAIPAWLDLWERTTGWLVDYEYSMRAHLALAAGLALAGARAFRGDAWGEEARSVWRSLGVAWATALVVFVADAGWLWREEAWIRYPTAAFLVGAGFFAATAARAERSPRDRAAWAVFAAAFVALGADELLSIHERLGRWIARLSPVAFHQDAMTWLYAIGGAAFLAVLLLAGVRYGPARHGWLMRRYAVAIGVFGAGQLGDALDGIARDRLAGAARALHDAGHRFPEVWQPFLLPRRWLNSVEELFELAAAVLLLAATRRAATAELAPSAGRRPVPGGRRRIGVWAFAIAAAALVAAGWPAAWRAFPFSGARPLAAVRALADEGVEPGVWIDDETSSVIVTVDGRPAIGLRLRRTLREASDVRWTEAGTLLLEVPPEDESFLPEMVFEVEAERVLDAAD